MKKITLLVVLFTAMSLSVFAQQNVDPAGAIINHYGARSYVAGVIPQADLDRIIQAGINAPSAMNRQPWHFTVVRDNALAKKLLSNVVEGNVLIVVSTQGDGETNSSHILDCALAVQSIYLAAQALGYGSRIYTGPIGSLNKNFKGELGIPSGSNAVALVRVGMVQGPVDAVSAASSRKKAEAMVTYK